LDWRWHARALELGCMFSINPDAHSVAELDLTHWGVKIARKGGVPKERVLNCLSLSGLTAYLAERRRQTAVPLSRRVVASQAGSSSPAARGERAKAQLLEHDPEKHART